MRHTPRPRSAILCHLFCRSPDDNRKPRHALDNDEPKRVRGRRGVQRDVAGGEQVGDVLPASEEGHDARAGEFGRIPLYSQCVVPLVVHHRTDETDMQSLPLGCREQPSARRPDPSRTACRTIITSRSTVACA